MQDRTCILPAPTDGQMTFVSLGRGLIQEFSGTLVSVQLAQSLGRAPIKEHGQMTSVSLGKLK